MTNKEFFQKTIEDEIPRFDRVFEVIPNKLKDSRAHPKNQKAEEIVRTLAFDSVSIPVILETAEFDFGEESSMDSGTTGEMAEMLKENMESAKEMVSKMSEEEWDMPAKLMMNGEIMWEATVGEAVWGTLFDMIHHRGQLSTHIRPQGGKVPSIYGPSGDSEM